MPDFKTMAEEAGAMLKQFGQTVAVAESSSGGIICAALLAVPGASAYFKGGGAVYTSASKQALMGLSTEALDEVRAATEGHALFLARAARARLGADWGIGETGAAGPAGNRYGDPAGHTCVGLVGPGVERTLIVKTGRKDRGANMEAFAQAAIELLSECLKQRSRARET
ncbi:MAG: CinA family protein [bacterium]|nr:CinA family protein [bacterium]